VYKQAFLIHFPCENQKELGSRSIFRDSQSLDVVMRIHKACPYVNIEWLLYGEGDIVNVVLPLGNGFSMPENPDRKVLLVGGGVGTAPMLYLGEALLKMGCKPTFLLGARSKNDLLQLEQFEQFGDVYTTTEDGSMGEKGYVTMHSVLKDNKFDMIYTCGPKPMMVAVAKYAKANNIECEVSLENTMACGVGACLCCVEKTDEGHVCVCKEGPVFNIKKLLWQI
jgi:dihydroorotate dehydrogenase electron transfer subunit